MLKLAGKVTIALAVPLTVPVQLASFTLTKLYVVVVIGETLIV